MEQRKQSRKTYSKEFKYKAVKMHKKGIMGYKAIAKEMGVPCHNMIKRWVANFDLYGVAGLEERRGKATGCRRSKIRSLTPEEELRRLRVEVELLKKIRALQRR
ncbi:MAG: transposase [Tumebacillaceae bacterium]